MKKILVIGSLNIDFVVDVENIPKPGETILATNVTYIPGGKGANQSYAVGKLGGLVSMIGVVGKDQYGEILLNNLTSVNVNIDHIQKSEGKQTGIALINVDKNGENSIVVVPGANSELSKQSIDENVSLIEQSDIIVMQLEVPIDTITYVAKLAKQKGKMIVLDPAPAKRDLPDELFACVDIIKPNETELEVLSGMKINSEEQIKNAANILLEKGVKVVIATLGEKGSMLVTKEGVKAFDALDVEAIDTTAAGDSFTAGFVVSLANGKTIEEAIKFGHIVSSVVVTKKGAQSSIPSMEEIQDFMRQYQN